MRQEAGEAGCRRGSRPCFVYVRMQTMQIHSDSTRTMEQALQLSRHYLATSSIRKQTDMSAINHLLTLATLL
jgi:hypothetical protein